MDDEIIKKKLLIDGDGIGDDKRINLFLKNFIKWCDQRGPAVNEGDEQQQTVNYQEESLNYEKMMALTGQCEHALNKSIMIQEVNQLEMDYYDELALKIQDTIEQTHIKIEELKSLLENAKLVKKNKLIYDNHAEVIFQHPARQQTIKLIEQINSEIKRLNEIKQILDANFESKKSQFKVLLDNLNELETSVNSNQDDLNREIQLLMDDEYYESLHLKKDKSVERELVLFKDPASFAQSKDHNEDYINSMLGMSNGNSSGNPVSNPPGNPAGSNGGNSIERMETN